MTLVCLHQGDEKERCVQPPSWEPVPLTDDRIALPVVVWHQPHPSFDQHNLRVARLRHALRLRALQSQQAVP